MTKKESNTVSIHELTERASRLGISDTKVTELLGKASGVDELITMVNSLEKAKKK